ncbi:MAG: AmmeMemoRadiSam system protein B, partial [Candidatus Odinarchaeia archaeon]
MSIRLPAAIGFYPGSKDELIKVIEECFLHKLGPGKLPDKKPSLKRSNILGGISPHAGYIYSGPIAANLFYTLSQSPAPDSIIIMGPSHSGYIGAAIMNKGIWRTPLGDVEIDEKLAEEIREITGVDSENKHYFVFDDWPHMSEHSLE